MYGTEKTLIFAALKLSFSADFCNSAEGQSNIDCIFISSGSVVFLIILFPDMRGLLDYEKPTGCESAFRSLKGALLLSKLFWNNNDRKVLLDVPLRNNFRCDHSIDCTLPMFFWRCHSETNYKAMCTFGIHQLWFGHFDLGFLKEKVQ